MLLLFVNVELTYVNSLTLVLLVDFAPKRKIRNDKIRKGKTLELKYVISSDSPILASRTIGSGCLTDHRAAIRQITCKICYIVGPPIRPCRSPPLAFCRIIVHAVYYHYYDYDLFIIISMMMIIIIIISIMMIIIIIVITIIICLLLLIHIHTYIY